MADNITYDWRSDKSLPECMAYMLENEIMCDVTLRVGNGQTLIKAHTFVLSSRSPVFYAMFQGPLHERGEVIITDIDAETFRDLLQYLYCDKLDISVENVVQMFYAAEKYMLPIVKTECMKNLEKETSIKNVVNQLQASQIFCLPEIRRMCLDFIEINTKKCLQSECLLYLSKECVELMLKSDYLDSSEVDIFIFLLKWAKAHCEISNIETTGQNITKQAGNLLSLLRLSFVRMDNFSKVQEMGLLTVEEVISIYEVYFGEHNERLNKNRRCPMRSRPTISVFRSKTVETYWTINTCDADAVIFTTDTDIWIKEIIVCTPIHSSNIYGFAAYDPDEYDKSSTFRYTLKVFDEKHQMVAEQTKCLSPDNTDESGLCNIMFPTPIRIVCGKKYTLYIKGNMKYISYYCINAKHSVSGMGVNIHFGDSSLCTTGTDKDKGQFAGIVFSVK